MTLPATIASQGLGARLIDSDASYFEAGAEVESIGGAGLAWLPGLEHLASAAVVYRIRPDRLPGSPLAWVKAVERRLRELGVTHARFYTTEGDPPGLGPALCASGYHRGEEIGLCARAGGRSAAAIRRPAVTLAPIIRADQWAEKRALHAASAGHPDGHAGSPEDWCDLERRRVAAGYMTSCLILDRDHRPCGTVGLAWQGPLLRFKNLLIHPDWRRQGYATASVAAIIRQAAGRTGHVGCFALSPGPALGMYHRLGFRPVTRQYEWFRALEPVRNPQ